MRVERAEFLDSREVGQYSMPRKGKFPFREAY